MATTVENIKKELKGYMFSVETKVVDGDVLAYINYIGTDGKPKSALVLPGFDYKLTMIR